MKNRFQIVILFLLPVFFSNAQEYPKGYFIPPLDTPLTITGVFGEVRENHLHSGIDISTDEETGLPLMASANGYISRVKVSSGGFGKVVYITHPNGFVTVYAHLEKFAIPISGVVRKYQFDNQVFELELNFKKNEYPVKQRDIIGYSGNSGSAEAPHVHFEIRDEKTEEPINPFLFGIQMRDTIPPILKYVRIYPQRENGIVEKTDSSRTYEIINLTGKNMLNISDFPLVYGNIAFGFSAVDYTDSMRAELGIYSSELFIDGSLVFTTRFDRFNFDNTRDVNAYIDYESLVRDHSKFERCHRLPGNHLNIFGAEQETGFVFFGEDLSHDIRIEVKDFSGNKAEISFTIICYTSLAEDKYQPKYEGSVLVTNEKGIGIHKSTLELVIPEGAAFENFYYYDQSTPDTRYLSDVFAVGDPHEALHKPFSIGIKPKKEIPDSLKSKLVVARVWASGALQSYGGTWNDKFLTAKSYDFGLFTVVPDTVPPVVEKYYTPTDMNSMFGGVVMIRIKDAFSGIKSYSGKIDGVWSLFEYDKKSDMLTANVDPLALNLTHPIEITVTDECGNTTIWKSTFYF